VVDGMEVVEVAGEGTVIVTVVGDITVDVTVMVVGDVNIVIEVLVIVVVVVLVLVIVDVLVAEEELQAIKPRTSDRTSARHSFFIASLLTLPGIAPFFINILPYPPMYA
jgi:hypothetical protein